jgi:hypothetical protein
MEALPTKKVILKTYRFVLSPEVIDNLAEFAKVHQHDDRKSFKEAWQKWIKDEDIEPIINDEVKRLKNSGFVGDVLDKMFKSTRYYYRNKSDSNNKDNENKTRKSYETVPRHILENIDKHIHTQINNKANCILKDNINISTVSPAESFNIYLNENKAELLKLLQESNKKISREDIENMIKKYKKTYKNRFYNIRVSLNIE